MVPAHCGGEVEQTGAVKLLDGDSGGPQPAPESDRGTQGSEPVGGNADGNAIPGPVDQGIGKSAARAVGPEDVIVEVDPPLGPGDQVKHGVERHWSVEQEADSVAGNGPATGSPVDRPLEGVRRQGMEAAGQSHGDPRPSNRS